MIETRDFDLRWEGRRCVVTQLGAKAARGVARRLLNTAGAALRELGAAGGEATAELLAAGAIIERVDDALLEWLTDTFAQVTRIERETGSEDWISPTEIMDLVFGGGPGLERWRRWLVFCVEMSCGDFFTGAAAEAAARQRQATQSRSQSTSGSRTTSTASPRAASTTTA